MTETHKLAADLDRRLLTLDQKIERHEKARQQADMALADLYQTRQALFAAYGALTRQEAAE
jgi:prefoldin subunit 5